MSLGYNIVRNLWTRNSSIVAKLVPPTRVWCWLVKLDTTTWSNDVMMECPRLTPFLSSSRFDGSTTHVFPSIVTSVCTITLIGALAWGGMTISCFSEILARWIASPASSGSVSYDISTFRNWRKISLPISMSVWGRGRMSLSHSIASLSFLI